MVLARWWPSFWAAATAGVQRPGSSCVQGIRWAGGSSLSPGKERIDRCAVGGPWSASSSVPAIWLLTSRTRWQTFIGGLLLHVSWKLGWVEINSSSRSNVLTWLPASVLFVGIIYAGSRALSRLAIPVFLTLHNVAEVIICGYQKCFRKEKTSPVKICSALFLLAAAGCLPFNDSQFDPDGYFWAVIHFFCVGAYKILQKFQKPSALSDIDQQYLNYIFSVALLAFASHPTGDLFSVLDFPFLYFYRFHGSCCASGFLGFFLMFSIVKLKSLLAPGQCAAWIFVAKLRLQARFTEAVVEQPGASGARRELATEFSCSSRTVRQRDKGTAVLEKTTPLSGYTSDRTVSALAAGATHTQALRGQQM
ncbi:transmembrane protein 241-like [Nycticebus coucang]|uniref:transmembrane protein 241-like n=1 Tax=Nycticebus coucang TaxID=9470 RepID=UPI00234C21FA|nr:transmembrane protein 241-like [Nycticebus coucang]